VKATRIDARSAAGIAEAVPRSAERPAALVALVAVSVSIALLTYLFAAPTGKIGGRFADVTTYYHAGEDFLQGPGHLRLRAFPAVATGRGPLRAARSAAHWPG